DAVPGLTIAEGLQDEFPSIETDDALAFACDLYRAMRDDLNAMLEARRDDREFIDETVEACNADNADADYLSPDYETVIGERTDEGRLVVGPREDRPDAEDLASVDVPEALDGEHVTLFGPPDTAKMSINAMNSLHRALPDEPELVGELVEATDQVPRWGADNEDSKTPIIRDFLASCRNLTGCFDRTLSFEDEERGKSYELADEGLATPIKRIPGLALPDGNHLLEGSPLPLHLYDFALHLFHNWDKPEALTFYVPKLENDEEAGYLRDLIAEAERRIKDEHPDYEMGSVSVFVVFENPRAIFRIREMAKELEPYFVGGSLGWHDFLASTARLFRHDPNYRIPVKSDPNIVINHIKESHRILVRELDPLDAVAIGGMYGVLYEGGNADSFQVSMVGYIKDVVTQLKRGLDGFWVAHPDFVRIGVALVEAYRRWEADPSDEVLDELIRQLVPDPDEHEPLLEFVHGDDVPGLDRDDPLYLRGVLAADVEESDVIANDDPEEVRYNVFQALQYLADWLSGNGCVALPSTMENASGDDVFVRVMDDLATTERSRWEVWAEVAHGRVPIEVFDAILTEELTFIREDRETANKRVQVTWDGENARWYPIAARILRQLVTSDDPPEFVSELLLPFTMDCVREADDPWRAAVDLEPGKYDTSWRPEMVVN
ncbi:MAG: hypothetical protein ABEN55_17540, partial [Bradymonadaceae bacterium]